MKSSSQDQSSSPPQRQTSRKRVNPPKRKLNDRDTDEQPLPLAKETERELLGVILLHGVELLQKATEAGLEAAILHIPSHRIIFSAYLDIQGRKWELTPMTLQDHLHTQHSLEKVGGASFIAELIDGRAPGPASVPGLIRQLKDINYKRQAMKKGAELQTLAGNGASPSEIEEFLDTIPRTHATVQKYTVTASGIVYRKPAKFGFGFENEPVTNFLAKIVTELNEDDGSSEEQKIFEVEVLVKNQMLRIEVPASKFDAMSWVTTMLGAEAFVLPGKEGHARCAIKSLSPGITKRTVYAHIGWRRIDNEWCYLHGAGAITGNGNRTDINVRLPQALRHYALPDPATGEAVVDAYQSAMELLDAFPRPLTVPLLGAVFGAILGDPDYSIYVAGQSGSFKSETTALAQSFFGAGFTRLTMPANWYDTGNVILAKAFTVKDALMMVDDFAPTGQKRHDDDLHTKAEIVFRAAGNRTGRGGLRSDMTVRVTKEPRGLLGSSGEDLPRGHSVQNRLLIIPITQGEITAEGLTAMQKMAGAGKFALSTSTFLSHLTRNYEKIKAKFDDERIAYRDRLVTQLGGHARQPTTAAHLAAAWRAWIRAAVNDKAISTETAQKLWREIWKTLTDAGRAQKEHQGTMHPVDHFLDLLRASLISGRANVQTVTGAQPPDIGLLCGWRDGKPNGDCVGWVDAGLLFLEMDTAYGVANSQGLRNNEGIAVGKRTLIQRLDERKLIVLKEDGRGYKYRTPGNQIPAIVIPLNSIFSSQAIEE